MTLLRTVIVGSYLRRDLITGDAKAAALELRAMAEVYIDGYQAAKDDAS